MCVCVGGGGGGSYSPPFLSIDHQEKKKIIWPYGPCRLMPGLYLCPSSPRVFTIIKFNIIIVFCHVRP